MNLNGRLEFSVTIPSYGPPAPTVPFASSAGGVLRPAALPSALDVATSVDNAVPGKVALAAESLAVVASATRLLTYVSHGIS